MTNFEQLKKIIDKNNVETRDTKYKMNINALYAISTICGLDLYNEKFIDIVEDKLHSDYNFMNDVIKAFKSCKMQRAVYLFECGSIFNDELHDFEILIDKVTESVNKFLASLNNIVGKYSKNGKIDKTTYYILHHAVHFTVIMQLAILSNSGAMCEYCLEDKLTEISQIIMNDISEGNDRLYRLIARLHMMCGYNDEAKTLLGFHYAKYHAPSDMNDLVYCYIQEMSENELTDEEISRIYNLAQSVRNSESLLSQAICLMDLGEYKRAEDLLIQSEKAWQEENNYSFQSFIIKYNILKNMSSCAESNYNNKLKNLINKHLEETLNDIKNRRGDIYDVARTLGISYSSIVKMSEDYVSSYYEAISQD